MALPATQEISRAYSTIVEEARRGRGEDRIAAIRLADRTVFVVADGAGGIAGGAAAADAVCRAVVEQCRNGTVSDWSDWLAHVDEELAVSGSSGLTAAVVVEVSDDGRVTGASAGDCEAWAFADGPPRSLTSGQVRKPLLGEGAALPVPFEACLVHGTLVVATDGLWKYANRERIAKAAAIRPLPTAAATLVDGVRLKSGALQDDVAIVICQVG
jgi:serine/threonine protein phosphatase PrpC